MPRPSNPINRPAYQGSNPVADIFSLWALQTTVKFLPRVAKNPDDLEARRQMLYEVKVLRMASQFHQSHLRRLASSFAGIGFGNAGVHLCHGMSYPVRNAGLGESSKLTIFAIDFGVEQKRSQVQTSRLLD